MKRLAVTLHNIDVVIAYDETSIHIYNAYPVKDTLKQRGYRWNADDRAWVLRPSDVAAEIHLLQNNLEAPGDSTVVSQTPPAAAAPPFAAVSPFPTAPSSLPAAPLPAAGGALSTLPASCSVLELRTRIDRLIREGIRGHIWVRGVVASQVKHYKWASYFDLKDEEQQSDAFFSVEVRRQVLERIQSRLRSGGVAQDLEKDLPVFCLMEVHLSLKNAAEVRLTMIDILPEYTQAKIRNQREITLERLQAEGLHLRQKELCLPALVFHIGLITSGQGTSIRDIQAGLHPHGARYDFAFIDTRMEGGGVVDGVLAAIEYFERHARTRPDAILLARGGGSEQSLAVFNDYRLCRRVCQCPIPVLTAIGHEKDVAAVELVSHFTPTPSTPSGLGKFLAERWLELRRLLWERTDRLVQGISAIHGRERERIHARLAVVPQRAGRLFVQQERGLRGLSVRLFHGAAAARRRREEDERRVRRYLDWVQAAAVGALNRGTSRIRRGVASFRTAAARINETGRSRVLALTRQLPAAQRRLLQRQERELKRLAAALPTQGRRVIALAERQLKQLGDITTAHNPDNILKKGFTLVIGPDGRVLGSLPDFRRVRHARLRFHDGETSIAEEEQP